MDHMAVVTWKAAALNIPALITFRSDPIVTTQAREVAQVKAVTADNQGSQDQAEDLVVDSEVKANKLAR